MAEQEKGFPYMPIYWGDWLTGQSTSDMTLEEEGAFLNLLLWAWGRKPACTLPNDREWLAAKSKLGKRFDKVWPKLRERFVVLDNGTLRNEKQWKIYQDRVRLSNSASNGGRKTQAKAKAERQADDQANLQAEGQAKTQLSVSESKSSILPEGAGPAVVNIPDSKIVKAAFAGLVKQHFWLSKEPPLHVLRKQSWSMGNEISIGEQWAKDYGGWDVVNAIIPLFRRVLDIDDDQPLSCAFFHARDARHKINQVIGHWQRQQEIDAEKNPFRLKLGA